ncbi:hypothetical protein EA658_14440 [Pseudoxanthomonas winnipegensis]|uniref:Uncharacterized protein n=1 Tax=Pseudoxanthomonas winnipegensis TaxID=2480810 RepID=A0ABY1WBD3_9GAMM|nr:hypothetical protein [Pseudoxanthomonas winnipegensis]TAA10892.1 hypothetical protein EA659_05850 [Pseudoxanthomonas winnipegensis]TAA18318.1 hypothetical protein EA658_14440 [Pseudoxanthomonas winnipegensis]TAH74307.1 hypothetical protein EA657_02310 [Pseudoxanthomonas winnipegensis]
MSKSTNDVAEMTPEEAREAASLVSFLLVTDAGKFMREFFPQGLEPRPSQDDFNNEDLHTYDMTWGMLDSLKATLHEVDDGSPQFMGYKRLLWWCDKVLGGETSFPSQHAAQCNNAWTRWARVRGIKRGIYRGGSRG